MLSQGQGSISEIRATRRFGVPAVRIDHGGTRPVLTTELILGSDAEALARITEFYRVIRKRRGKLSDSQRSIDTFELHH